MMTLHPSLHIRLASPEDHAAIAKVNRLAWETSYLHLYSLIEIDALFNHQVQQAGSWVTRRDYPLRTLVATEKNTIIGFIAMSSLQVQQHAEITSFYVHPARQGVGVGRALWDAALHHLQQRGYAAFWVWVLEKADARRFYEARGCVEQERGVYRVGDHVEEAIGYFYAFSASS